MVVINEYVLGTVQTSCPRSDVMLNYSMILSPTFLQWMHAAHARASVTPIFCAVDRASHIPVWDQSCPDDSSLLPSNSVVRTVFRPTMMKP